MQATTVLPASFDVGFEQTSEGLSLVFGRAEISLKRSGEIVLKNDRSCVRLTALGQVNVSGQHDIKINSDHHICLNTR